MATKKSKKPMTPAQKKAADQKKRDAEANKKGGSIRGGRNAQRDALKDIL